MTEPSVSCWPSSIVGAVDDTRDAGVARRETVYAFSWPSSSVMVSMRVLSPSSMVELAGDLGEDRLALRLAGLEELGDTRETVGDVLTRDTTGVERTHRELRARLADRLGGDDADRGADVDGAAAGEVPAVAGLADAVLARGRS